MSNGPKISLVLLKKLVTALEDNLNAAEAIKNKADEGSDVNDYVIEMSKAAGICMSIMQESTMLVGDVQTLIKHTTSGSEKPSNTLESLFQSFKVPGAGGKN